MPSPEPDSRSGSSVPKEAPPDGGASFGAGDRTRTGTRLPARDFKSLVSTIPPHRRGANTVSRAAGGVKGAGMCFPEIGLCLFHGDEAVFLHRDAHAVLHIGEEFFVRFKRESARKAQFINCVFNIFHIHNYIIFRR